MIFDYDNQTSRRVRADDHRKYSVQLERRCRDGHQYDEDSVCVRCLRDVDEIVSRDIARRVFGEIGDCPECGNSGFSGYGTGYGDVCGFCGGTSATFGGLPIASGGVRRVSESSGSGGE